MTIAFLVHKIIQKKKSGSGKHFFWGDLEPFVKTIRPAIMAIILTC